MDDLKAVLGADDNGMDMDEMDFKEPELGEKRDVSVSGITAPAAPAVGRIWNAAAGVAGRSRSSQRPVLLVPPIFPGDSTPRSPQSTSSFSLTLPAPPTLQGGEGGVFKEIVKYGSGWEHPENGDKVTGE